MDCFSSASKELLTVGIGTSPSSKYDSSSSLLNLRGVVRTSQTTLNGRSYQNLDAFAPAAEWEALPHPVIDPAEDRRDADGL
jgi:hypothetical protein